MYSCGRKIRFKKTIAPENLAAGNALYVVAIHSSLLCSESIIEPCIRHRWRMPVAYVRRWRCRVALQVPCCFLRNGFRPLLTRKLNSQRSYGIRESYFWKRVFFFFSYSTILNFNRKLSPPDLRSYVNPISSRSLSLNRQNLTCCFP